MRTVATSRGVLDALFGKSKQAILGLFLGDPESELHLREVARRTEISIGAVTRELSSLVEAGILIRHKRGNQVFYHADREGRIYPELHSLIVKTVGLADRFKEAFKPLSDKITVAFIYGSMARGDEKADSDVDLMVIGDVKTLDVVKALSTLHQLFKREINPTVFTAEEYKLKLLADNHFLKALLTEPKIFLIGDEDEFRRLA